MRRIVYWSAMVALFVGWPGTTGKSQGGGTQCEGARMTQQQLVQCVRDEAQSWIELVPFEGEESEGGLAIRSFPDGPEFLARRTFLYDQALAILWFAWRGEYDRARGLARTLEALQMEDGSWGFSFEPGEGGFYDAGYVRTGAVAWAGWALAYYGERADDEGALETARRARAYVDGTLVTGGIPLAENLYAAGVGHHDPNTGERVLGRPVNFVSTEHQFDVHEFLGALDPQGEAVAALEERILETLWLDEQGRFAMGVQPGGIDERRALDTSGGWGALWLLSVERPDLARRSLDYTLRHFPARSASVDDGFVPYLDAVDGYDPQREVIFVEGSLGVALAASRLGEEGIARRILAMAATLADGAGGTAIPYADRSQGDFTTATAAAPTLWFLMVEREMATGLRAPLFVP